MPASSPVDSGRHYNVDLASPLNTVADSTYGGRPVCYGRCHPHLTAWAAKQRILDSLEATAQKAHHDVMNVSLVPVHPASVMNVLAQTTAAQAVVHAMAVGRQLQQTQVAKVGTTLAHALHPQEVEEDQTVPRTWSKEPTISGSTTVDMKEMEAIAEDLGIVISRQLEGVFTHQELPLATLNNQTPRPFGALPSSPVKSNHLMRKKEKEVDPGEIIIIELTTSLKGSQHQKPTCSKSFLSSFGKPI